MISSGVRSRPFCQEERVLTASRLSSLHVWYPKDLLTGVWWTKCPCHCILYIKPMHMWTILHFFKASNFNAFFLPFFSFQNDWSGSSKSLGFAILWVFQGKYLDTTKKVNFPLTWDFTAKKIRALFLQTIGCVIGEHWAAKGLGSYIFSCKILDDCNFG